MLRVLSSNNIISDDRKLENYINEEVDNEVENEDED